MSSIDIIITGYILCIKPLKKQVSLCFTLLTLINGGFKSFKSKHLLVKIHLWINSESAQKPMGRGLVHKVPRVLLKSAKNSSRFW